MRFVRAEPDTTQRWRRSVQLVFLLLNVAIGVQFWLFVSFFESGGAGVYLPRPPGIEGWLPIAALMNLKVALLTGELPRHFPAGLVLLVAFLAITFLFRKAFCSWLCPVGTISEGLWKLGRRLSRRTFALPRWLDWPLRAPKYLLLAFFLWAVASMSVEEIGAFLASPYGVVADVKMLDFFRHMGAATAIVLSILAVASLLIQNPWCRYLCPYGALHGLVSWLSPVRIRRDPRTCIDCEKCSRACPSRLAVDTKASIASPECTACLECVAACPVKDALEFSVTSRGRLPTWLVAAGIAALFLVLVGLARVTGHWKTAVDRPAVGDEDRPRSEGVLGPAREGCQVEEADRPRGDPGRTCGVGRARRAVVEGDARRRPPGRVPVGRPLVRPMSSAVARGPSRWSESPPGAWTLRQGAVDAVRCSSLVGGKQRGVTMKKNTICLWYDHDAEEAARFYARTFPGSTVGAVHRAPSDFPGGKAGSVLTVEFTVCGVSCLGLNGGDAFKQTEAFSFQIATDDQAETDRYWNAIVGNGGAESACGWCKDKWGLSWQITPRVLTEAMARGGDVAKRAFEAMMEMRKIDVAKIEAAVRG